jgi:hypothetical protein
MNGRNFYKVKEKVITHPRFIEVKKIYIDCYARNFNVGRLGKNGLTYSLDIEEVNFLESEFSKRMIPFQINKSIGIVA